VIVTEELAPTATVVIVNCTELEPAGTTTLAGTDATAGLLLDSVTTNPRARCAP